MGESGASDLTLLDCPRDAHVLIDTIDLDERHRFRLCEIGLAPGTSLKVVQRAIRVRPAHDGENQTGVSAMNDASKGEKDGR